MSSDTTIPGLVISADHPALATLPAAQREAAAAAITAAFPGASLDALTFLHGGLSGTLVCRIQVGTHAYVLRAIVQRQDAVGTPYARVQNLGRVRVVVS